MPSDAYLFDNVLPGKYLPYFELATTTGERWTSTDLLGRRQVLAFVGGGNDGRGERLLQDLQAALPDILVNGAAVLAIVPRAVDLDNFDEPEVQVAFPVLIDLNSDVHRTYGAVDWSGAPATSLFVTDVTGRVIYRALAGFREQLPSMANLIVILQSDEIAPGVG